MEQTIMSYEFVFIFFACFIVFLLISMLIKQKQIRKLSMLLFSIFIVFSLFELVLSIFCDKNKTECYYNYLNEIIIDKIQIDRDVHFFDRNNNKCKIRNSKDKLDLNNYDYYKIIYDTTYSTYCNNFRQTKGDINSKETYVFLGCSFTFGDGVNDNETSSYFFSEKFNFGRNIINCGVQGKSSNTTLNILNNKMVLPLIKNKDSKIEHCFYSLMEDHIYRNFRYEGDCLDGYLYKDGKESIPTTIGKIKYVFARSYTFRKVFAPIIDEIFKKYYEDYMVQSLEEINKIVEEKYKSKLTIIVWREKEYSSYFINKLKGTNLDLIFLDEKFNLEKEGYRIKNDGHPTAKANKEIAEILYNHINKIDE